MTVGIKLSKLHYLLLTAALQPEKEALKAWDEWQKQSDWKGSSLDGASYRLLPLVYKNIKSSEQEVAGLPRLKGLYRRAWYENARLLHSVQPVFKLLQEVNIPTVVFKGTSMLLHYYKDLAARPMGDVDILVPEEFAEKALHLLLENGWVSDHYLFTAYDQFNYYHATNLINPNGGHVDLHRFLFAEDLRSGLNDKVWQVASPLIYNDMGLLLLSPADELLLTCIHGWRYGVDSIIWVSDAIHILRSETMDWERFVEEAARRNLSLRAKHALAFLNECFENTVPEFVFHQFEQYSPAVFEAAEEEIFLRPQGWVPISVYKIYYWYVRKHGYPNGLMGWFRLGREYIRYLWLFPNFKQFPQWVNKRLRLAGLIKDK